MIPQYYVMLFMFIGATGSTVAAFRLATHPSYSARRLTAAAWAEVGLGLSLIAGGIYESIQHRTPTTILQIVAGATCLLSAAVTFHSARRKAQLEAQTAKV